jgi:hypothetical protein
MYLKDVLGDIQTNCGNFHGGRLPSAPGFDSQEHGTLMPLGGRPPHHVNPIWRGKPGPAKLTA